MTTLSEKAMLARLSISQWSARKTDKRVTAEVKESHHLAEDAGKWNKQLLGPEALKAIQECVSAGRTAHYKYSLPWKDDGARILPARAWEEYSADMRRLRVEFEYAVDQFCGAYPDFVDAARARLNGTFDEADYPKAGKIRERFSWDVSFDPLPSGDDFRVSMSDEEAERVRADIDERTRAAVSAGMADAWRRLHEALARCIERLGDPKAVFRDSLIGNLRELCDVLPLLNVTDSPELEEARRRVAESLADLDPEVLRMNGAERTKAADAARAIMADLGPYMMAAPADTCEVLVGS